MTDRDRNVTALITFILILVSVSAVNGKDNAMQATAVTIDITLKSGTVFDPFVEFTIPFEIVNHTAAEIRLRSADDVRVTLSTGGTTVYTRSLELPATAAALR